MNNVKILVAVHKNYEMPQDTNTYIPVFVGKDLHPNVNNTFQGDNTGDNISGKNAHYNELTAIYWAWKNLETTDAIGLVHYRRYFTNGHKKTLDSILSQEDFQKLLKQAPIILPKKRCYYVESNYSHYIHAHHREPLDVTRNIIKKRYPRYLNAFEEVMNARSAHMFNMFVMEKKYFNKYCEWMFTVLKELEDCIDISTYDSYETRVFGFVSELLLDVWIKTNKVSFVETDYTFMEKQNWLEKGSKFLWRKIVNEKK
ncbi:DUF4422 domain-containing protein [Lactiplantibacillus mudanjiangensis]|uniref:Exopolysaccharide biosynthesis protein [Lactobacillus backii] n=1 Tax=Lactiplantibacillus mudanjiangensis TaxID=1296538 RepID=A0A660E662_9LACO|nr:DUF4422 domain-containing protein [Lactiplantibacillus mudanjiangensis]VDG23459.1 exopolysaccharide biosynthesis protein [Lactobacillus backii] [Lactiplantibacillus mudanjiangensis]VDG29637.1 exopolysaccharide biosynthesis protein [Lactobacillus backii] [Lactiplantibacillus mudanjiangensis]